MRSLLSSLVLASLMAACEKEPEAATPEAPQAQEVILQVRTVDKTNAPVEMVRFYINGKKFGITDQDGAFKGRYPAKDGELLTFNVEAPAGYSVPANIDQSRWRHQVKYPAGGRPLQLNFTATLQRPERDYLFLVNSKTPATPITVNGKAVGKTGNAGEALVLVRGEPGAQFAARAGAVILNGEFAEDEEVYLLTAARQGAVGGGPAGDQAAAEPAAPESVAAESAAPESVAPESLAAVAPDSAVPSDAPPPVPATEAPVTVAEAPPTAAPETVAAAPETVAAAVVTEPPPPVEIAPETAAPRRAPPPEDPFEKVAGPGRQEGRQPEVAVERPRDPVVVDRRRDPEPLPERPRRPEPPEEVEVKPPPRQPPPEEDPVIDTGGGDGMKELVFDKAPETDAPAPVTDAPATEPPRKPKTDDGLIDDDGPEVSRDVKPTIGGAAGPVASGMSREEISSRLDSISAGLASSGVLKKADVDFLGQVDRTHPGYPEANRLLAEFYYQLKDYKRQAEALEIATTQGRYKHDPTILLSLAKAYALRKNYGKALGTMRRVEEKMRTLPAAKKADAFRFYAEILEFEFLRQHDEDAKGANVTLVDKAIEKWERYRTFNQGADPGGVAKAEKKIKELQELKLKMEP